MTYQPRLHRLALLTAAATLALIGLGGLVTSHGVGMAVPDWPNTYGYNMFFFPFSQWVGGIFYEHTHRLVASGVGFLMTVLALAFYGRNARPMLRWGGLTFLVLATVSWVSFPQRWPDAVVLAVVGAVATAVSWFGPKSEPAPRWLRRLGIAGFVLVVFQGLLGGLRVVLFKDQIGIFHATLAQLFFLFVCFLALCTSRWWVQPEGLRSTPPIPVGLSRLLLLVSGLILLQLVLGATMRHQHAGLAVPDFPLAYGKLWPAMDADSVARYNQQRLEVTAANPITGFQIGLHMAHRLLAMGILGAVALAAWSARRQLGGKHFLARGTALWLMLILVQALLGAATIWFNKAADIATAHVVIGSLSLTLGGLLSAAALAKQAIARQPASHPAETHLAPASVFGGGFARPSPSTGCK